MKIAIDAMSGDNGLAATVPAVCDVLARYPELQITLVGIEAEIREKLKTCKISKQQADSIIIHNATEVVGMDESPIAAMRYKKDSSMRKAIDLVKDNSVDACVSAGNTGALMGISKFVLKTIHGVSRPAIVSAIPTIKGYSILLDLGANINCTALNLYQFALMGAILKKSLAKDPNFTPKVALLNIGEEELKGTEVIKEAAQMIAKNSDLNYIGYIEGNDLYNDIADVIVCDGFVGNVALKTSEGLSKFISDIFKKAYTRNWYTKLLGLLTTPIVNSIRTKLDPRNYNGASLLGLNGLVIKSHGGADSKAFANAIIQAKKEVENDIISEIKKSAYILDFVPSESKSQNINNSDY